MKLSKPIKAIFKNEIFLLNIYLVTVTIIMFIMIFIIDIKDLYNIIFFMIIPIGMQDIFLDDLSISQELQYREFYYLRGNFLKAKFITVLIRNLIAIIYLLILGIVINTIFKNYINFNQLLSMFLSMITMLTFFNILGIFSESHNKKFLTIKNLKSSILYFFIYIITSFIFSITKDAFNDNIKIIYKILILTIQWGIIGIFFRLSKKAYLKKLEI